MRRPGGKEGGREGGREVDRYQAISAVVTRPQLQNAHSTLEYESVPWL